MFVKMVFGASKAPPWWRGLEDTMPTAAAFLKLKPPEYFSVEAGLFGLFVYTDQAIQATKSDELSL